MTKVSTATEADRIKKGKRGYEIQGHHRYTWFEILLAKHLEREYSRAECSAVATVSHYMKNANEGYAEPERTCRSNLEGLWLPRSNLNEPELQVAETRLASA